MLFTLRSIVLFSSSIAVALSHLVIPAGQPDDSYLMELARHLKKHFDIQHATVRVEGPILTRRFGVLPCR